MSNPNIADECFAKLVFEIQFPELASYVDIYKELNDNIVQIYLEDGSAYIFTVMGGIAYNEYDQRYILEKVKGPSDPHHVNQVR